jgi:hypothetical protein
MPSITGLFPKRRVTWGLWLILLLIVFPFYYFRGVYSTLNSMYERVRWKVCPTLPNEEYCVKTDPDTGLELRTRAPAYVTDFIEVPLEIWVTNTATRTQSAVVTVELKPSNSNSNDIVHIWRKGEDQEQNSVAFTDIPPHGGKAVATFLIRVSGGAEKSQYHWDVRLKEKTMQPINYVSSFDSREVLRLWIIQHLLSPPGANIVLPVCSLLAVSLSEAAYRASVSCKRRCCVKEKRWQNLREMMLENWVFGAILIGMTFAAWVVVRSIWSDLAQYGLAIGIVAVGVGLVIGLAQKISSEEEKPEWIPPCKQAPVSAGVPTSSASAGSGADQSLGSGSSSS